jgi:hypothetical protein
MSRIKNSEMGMALIAIACGGYALLLASGVIPGQMANDTPVWIVAAAGMAFVIAGFMIFLRNHSRALDLLAAILLGAFTAITGWITFYSSPEGFSGGIPFLPRDMNVSVGRIMFGLGTLMCFAGFLYALKRFFGSHK